MAENQTATTGSQSAADDIDTATPHVARILDYLLGGTANYESDRNLAHMAFANWPGETGGVPGVRVDIRAARDALRRIVHLLVRERGIRQFIDFASGLPTMHNVHLAAREITDDARVVYVDNDPRVVLHARKLLADETHGRTVFLDADFRDPKDILRRASATLDLTKPVAFIMFGMLHFIEDEDHPEEIVKVLLDAVPSGSYMAFSHFAVAEGDDAMNQTLDAMDKQMGEAVVRRTRAEAAAFFDGMDVLEPGVVGTDEWRPPAGPAGPKPLPMWVGVARKR